MACEKYAGWMIDAAIGALPPARESELRAHIAGCCVCNDSYQRARSLAAAVDGGVRSLVSAEPSAHFETRLRARLAEESSPRSAGRLVWIPVGGAALAAAAVVAFFLVRATDRQVPPAISVASRVDTPAPQAPGIVADQTVRPAEPDSAHLAQRSSNRQMQRESRVLQPEILVPAGQWDAVLNFAEAVRDGRIDGAQLIKVQEAQPQDADAPVTIEPVQIAPLDIPKIQISGDIGDSDDSTDRS